MGRAPVKIMRVVIGIGAHTWPRGRSRAYRRTVWVLQQNLRDQGLLRRLEEDLDRLGLRWISVAVGADTPPTLPAAVLAGPIICYGASFVPMIGADAVDPGHLLR